MGYTTTRATTPRLSDAIADGEVGKAPTQNAVFDALAAAEVGDTAALALKVTAAGGDASATVVTPDDGAAELPLRTWLRQPFINVMAFSETANAVGDGVTDDTNAIKAAITLAKAHSPPLAIYFPTPPVEYLVTAVLTNFENTSGMHFFGDGPDLSKIRLELSVANDSPFEFVGTMVALASAPALTSGAAAGTHTLELASTTGMTAGQYIVIQDTSQVIIDHNDGSTVCDVGQVARIKTVTDTTHLELYDDATFTYTTSTKVRAITSINGLTVHDLGFIYDSTDDFNVFNLFKVVGLRMWNLKFWGNVGDAIRMDTCINVMIDRVDGYDFAVDATSTPYLVNASVGSANGRVTNCYQRGGRHLFDGGSGPGYIESANWLVAHNMVEGNYASGLGTHVGMRCATFDSNITCPAQNPGFSGDDDAHGIQIRGRYCDVINHTTIGGDAGAAFFHGEYNRLIGGKFINCNIGIIVEESHYTSLEGDWVVHNPITTGVAINRNGASMPGFRMRNGRVVGNPSGYAFSAATWEQSYLISNVEAADASSLTDNIPAYAFRPVYQEFTASGTWTKPPGLKAATFEVIGGGGGGGGGCRTASGSASSGGGGGGGGAIFLRKFDAADLGSTETVTVGAGGTGGAGSTSNGVAGSDGNGGNTTSVGSIMRALGGGGGAGGEPAANSGGGGGAGAFGAGGNATTTTAGTAGSTGGSAGGSGGAATANAVPCGGGGGGGGQNTAAGGNGAPTVGGPGGGGAGGGISTAPAAFDGGAAGRSPEYTASIPGATGAAAGTTPTAPKGGAGAGGAGGASNAAGVGGAGGAGAPNGGGGGGGGGSGVAANGGAGGAGADGIVRVWMEYES